MFRSQLPCNFEQRYASCSSTQFYWYIILSICYEQHHFDCIVNRCPLNNFNCLAFMTMKIMMPKTTKYNVTFMYHWVLQVHSISCIIEICSCFASFPPICCKTRLVTRDFNFACLYIIYITIDVMTNEIIVVTNRKMSRVYLLKGNFCQSNTNHYH